MELCSLRQYILFASHTIKHHPTSVSKGWSLQFDRKYWECEKNVGKSGGLRPIHFVSSCAGNLSTTVVHVTAARNPRMRITNSFFDGGFWIFQTGNRTDTFADIILYVESRSSTWFMLELASTQRKHSDKSDGRDLRFVCMSRRVDRVIFGHNTNLKTLFVLDKYLKRLNHVDACFD